MFLSSNTVFYALLCSFITTLMALKVGFKMSFKIGLLDYPGGRKKHNRPIPLVGGIAIFIGFNVTLFLLFHGVFQNFFWFFSASILLVTVSIIDDKKPLSVKMRIFVHIAATFIVITAENAGLNQLPLPLIVFTVVGAVNALNMMDGLDGLVGCISLITCCVLLYLAVQIGAALESLLLISLIGALAAFLLFNFPSSYTNKRKIFLGDVGSMFLGFFLSWISMRLTECPHGYPPTLMLWILALPIMDTLHLIINRKARGRSPFRSDRRHIHHMLLHLHYTPCQTVFTLMGLSFCCNTLGIVLYYLYNSEVVLIIGYITLFFIYFHCSYLIKKKVALKTSAYLPSNSFFWFLSQFNNKLVGTMHKLKIKFMSRQNNLLE